MILLETQPPNPDTLFWYTISSVLAVALLGIIMWYLNKNEAILKGVSETLQRLVTNDAVKEQRLNDLDERVESIEDKVYPINYKSRR